MTCIFRYILSKVHWLRSAAAPCPYIGLLAASIANAELVGLQQTLTSDQSPLAQPSQVNDRPSHRSSKKPSSSLESDRSSDESAAILYRLQLFVIELARLKSLVREQGVVLKQTISERNKQQPEVAARLTEFGYSTVTNAVKNLEVKKAREEHTAYKVAFELASQQRFNEAIKLFQDVLVDYPDGRLSADALFWIGEICLILSEPQIEKSRQAYMQLLQRFPEHQYVAAALYKLGHIHHQLGQKRTSKEFFGRLIQEYPGSTAAQLANYYEN